jgi:hypothetical protein
MAYIRHSGGGLAFAGVTGPCYLEEDFSKTDSPGLGHRKFADFHKELPLVKFWKSLSVCHSEGATISSLMVKTKYLFSLFSTDHQI